MSAYWMLENVWAYSVQFAAVAAFALLLARLSRSSAPRMRLGLLQLGLVLALVAPFLLVQSSPVAVAPAFGSIAIDEGAGVPLAPRSLRPTTVAVAFLLAGVCLRLGWTLIGLIALARQRRRARAAGSQIFADLCVRLGVHADLLAGPSGPVAFGVFRPAVLVPEALLAGNPATQRAVLAHELVHLRRRDWLFVLGEELIAAALWFHPLAWLLVREIRLTREEEVDRQAAQAVSGAEPYLEALLAVARVRFQPAHGVGSEFLRERQIARRIATLIRQENPMPRLMQHGLTSISVLALAGAAWWAASFSPLQAAPQSAPLFADASGGVSVSGGAEGLTLPRQGKSLTSTYSLGAQLRGVEGKVTLELTLDDSGNVVDARVISGPLELRQEAVRWALDWRYDPAVQPSRTVIATVDFTLPGNPPQAYLPLTAVRGVIERADIPRESLVLRSVQIADPAAISPGLSAKLESYVGQSFGADPNLGWTIHGDILDALAASDRKGTVGWVALREDGATLIVGSGMAASSSPPAAREAAPAPPGRILVGREVQSRRVVRQIRPNYPPLARQARIQGTVNLEAVIGRDGAVLTLDVLSGHPLLIPAAVEAVKQWRYKPTLLNGQPVEVQTTIDVNFTLSK